jgi:hypothetical protein
MDYFFIARPLFPLDTLHTHDSKNKNRQKGLKQQTHGL